MKNCPHCGKSIHAARSPDDHRRLFGLINAAYHHWSEAHDFQPDSSEALRSWLLCKAGYRDVVTIPVPGDSPEVARLAVLAVEGALKAAKSHAFVRPHGAGLAVFTPKSLAFDKLDQRSFGPIRDAVEALIEQETGLAADQLLKEHEAAA